MYSLLWVMQDLHHPPYLRLPRLGPEKPSNLYVENTPVARASASYLKETTGGEFRVYRV